MVCRTQVRQCHRRSDERWRVEPNPVAVRSRFRFWVGVHCFCGVPHPHLLGELHPKAGLSPFGLMD